MWRDLRASISSPAGQVAPQQPSNGEHRGQCHSSLEYGSNFAGAAQIVILDAVVGALLVGPAEPGADAGS